MATLKVSKTGLAERNSLYQNSLANSDDNQIIVMLAEMRHSPRLSRRSSVRKKTAPTRRTKFHRPNKPSHFLMQQQAPNEPAQQPISSRHSQPPNVARRKRVSTICVTWSRTLRRAKTKKSAVLWEHANKRTSSIGQQYRPKPHLRADKDFQTCLHQICSRAEQDLRRFMIRPLEKNLSSDMKPLRTLKRR